jgi:hypothetical protein
MLRFRGIGLLTAAVVVSMLAGCGGGGGGSSDPITPPVTPTTDVTVTGKVISSVTNQGVPGVTVIYGSAYATTDSAGAYKLTFSPKVSELPYFLQVDTTGAGAAFPSSQMVLVNSQTYEPGQVDMPVTVLNGSVTSFPTITVQQITQDNPGLPPYANHDVLIYGRVVEALDGSAVVGATVKLGLPSSPARTVTTGARGYFAFNLGKDMQLADVVGTNQYFSVDLSTATGLTGTYYIAYGSGDVYFQNQAIAIPSSVDNIGVIKVTTTAPSGPPPPPQ